MRIDWAPSSDAAEIAQNVGCCLLPRGTVPFQRGMGLRASVDASALAGRAILTTEVLESIERYEPRVAVTRVVLEQAAADEIDGRMRPVVTYERRQ